MHKWIFAILIFLILPWVLFYKSFFVFFVQDDYFLLDISNIKTIVEFLNFFRPLSETVWYRPLSSQVFFYITQNLFGLHVFTYHILVFLTHSGTMMFIYLLVKKISIDKNAALIAALIYGCHQLHTISLSWLASYSFVLGPLLFVSGVYSYLNRRYIVAYVLLFAGLLTSEVLIILFFLYILIDIILYKCIFIFRSILFLIPVITLFIIRFILVPTSNTSSLYKVSLSLENLSIIKFYVFRLIGIPYFIQGMPLVLKAVSLVLICVFLIVFLFSLFYSFKRSGTWRQLIIMLAILIIGIAPFVVFKNHSAPYYAVYSLVGFSGICGIVLKNFVGSRNNRNKNIGIFILLSVFISLQQIGSYWDYETHWLFKRSVIAKKNVTDGNYIFPVGSEEYYALGADAAYKFFEN